MTRTLRRPAAAALAAGLALLAGAVPARAAVGGAISNIEVGRDTLTFVFEATSTESALTPDSVRVQINGEDVDRTVVPLTGNGGSGQVASIERTTILAMDTSGSMNDGKRLDGAKQAANAFLTAAPADVRVGLVTFSDTARLVVAPSTNRIALRQRISGLKADGGTAIYDGVRLAAETLGARGLRNIVLLTDGVNDGSKATLEQAAAAVSARKVTLDAVSFQTQNGRAALDRLAAAGKGRVVTAGGADELTKQFRQAAQRLSGQLLVSVPLTAQIPTGQVTLTATGTVDGRTVTDSAAALISRVTTSASPVDPRPRPAHISAGPLAGENAIWVVVGIFFIGLCGILVFALNAAVPGQQKSVSKKLSVYTLSSRQPKEQVRETTAFGDSAVVHSAVDLAGRIAAKRGLEERLQRRLEAGAVPLKPAEWIIVHVGGVLLVPLFTFLLTGQNVVLTLLALVVAAGGPFVYLSLKESRRRTKFLDQLPETLQVMAGSLSAGYSLPQAADTVVREGSDPISTEFNRALVEARLGVPIEDALESIADRMRSQDWAWVVMAIRVQREVGGNLAELLTTVSETLRERARLRRQVQVLSAEGRLSAWILGSLPVVFALYLLVARPSYIMMLGKELLGWIMIIGGVISLIVGALWMKKVVDVEV